MTFKITYFRGFPLLPCRAHPRQCVTASPLHGYTGHGELSDTSLKTAVEKFALTCIITLHPSNENRRDITVVCGQGSLDFVTAQDASREQKSQAREVKLTITHHTSTGESTLVL
ncbi:hypothetical protein J6590_065715 [Homalodisca vitripennis]|nr:hypothetical protein J6590_065715 [Homalodisca vitripennis]